MLENILLFLFALNFLNNGHLFLILLLVISVLQSRALRINRDFWILSVFSLLYFAFDWFLNQSLSVLVLISPVAFLVGCNLDLFEGRQQLEQRILVITLGMFTHMLLNFAYTQFRCGFLYLGTQHYDIWSGAVSAVTAQMVNYVLLICYLGCCAFFFKRYKFLIPLLAFCLFHAIICGSRSVVLFFLISALVSFAAMLISQRKRKVKKIILVIIISLAALFVFYLCFELNLFHIRTLWRSSYLYHRLFSEYAVETNASLFSSSRWITKLRYIRLILDYPFGGEHIRAIVGPYAHDIWLDSADRVGVIPMLILLLYTVKMGFRVLRHLRQLLFFTENTDSVDFSVFFAAYFVLVLIQFLIEPVLIGSIVLFHSACIIDGMLASGAAGLSSEESRQQLPLQTPNGG